MLENNSDAIKFGFLLIGIVAIFGGLFASLSYWSLKKFFLRKPASRFGYVLTSLSGACVFVALAYGVVSTSELNQPPRVNVSGFKENERCVYVDRIRKGGRRVITIMPPFSLHDPSKYKTYQDFCRLEKDTEYNFFCKSIGETLVLSSDGQTAQLGQKWYHWLWGRSALCRRVDRLPK